MKVALIGARGIPASYSGFETCAENLGARLVVRGHAVTVYNRAHHIPYRESVYKGMRLVRVRGIATKHLDTITHTALSMLHALTQNYDAMIVFIAGNAPLCVIPRLFSRARVVLNVDGLDWKRKKWGGAARGYLRWSEQAAHHVAHVVVTDSRRVQEYYRREHKVETVFIPYGADVAARPPGDVLNRFGLEPRKYVLFVGRLVPENCAHHLVDAWSAIQRFAAQTGDDVKCVIVGDAPYAASYIESLKARAGSNPSIVFTGYQEHPADWITGFDVGLLPSCFTGESLPCAIIECLTLGKPVIATAVGGVPEMLDSPDGPCGILIPLAEDTGCADVNALAEAMHRLAADSRLLETMATRARKASLRYDATTCSRACATFFRHIQDSHLPSTRPARSVAGALNII